MSAQPQDPQAVERYMPAYDRDSTMRTVAYMEPSPYGRYVGLDAYEDLEKSRDAARSLIQRFLDDGYNREYAERFMKSMPQKGGE